MADITVDTLASFLDALGWKYDHDRERAQILTVARGPHATISLVLRILQGAALSICTMRLAYVQEQRRMECLQALLMINYGSSLGGFGIDLRDNEITYEICVPLAGADLDQAQFSFLLNRTCWLADEGYAVLNTVQWSQRPPAEVVLEMLSPEGETEV